MTSPNDLDQGGLYRPLRRVYRSPTLGWLYDIGDQQVLDGDVNYFVSKFGNDNNDGLTSGGAFKTIQQLLNTVSTLNFNGHYVTGTVGPGTYNEDLVFQAGLVNAPYVGFSLIGDETTPSNCVISSASTCLFAAGVGADIFVSGFKLVCPVGTALNTLGGGTIQIGAMEFGDCTGGYHMIGVGAGGIGWSTNKNMTISGNAIAHIAGFGNVCSMGGSAVHTVNLVGNPNFSDAFLVGEGAGMDMENITFVGSATGKRFRLDYSAHLALSLTDTLTHLPGNQPGIADETSTVNFVAGIASQDLGTVSSGTIAAFDIPNAFDRQLFYTNNGAHTFPAPLIDGKLVVLITNGASAGTITWTGFTTKAAPGDTLDTVNGHKFLIEIFTINGVSTRRVYALQ